MSSGADALLAEYIGVLPATPEAVALRQLLEIGVAIVKGDEGSLLVMDEDAGVLRFAMNVGAAGPNQNILEQTVPMGSGVTGLAAMSRQVQVGAPVYRDVQQTDRLSAGPETVIAAPMLLGEAVIGVLTAVSFQEGRVFTAQEADLYARFACAAALVVDQARKLEAHKGEISHARGLGEAALLELEILGRLQRIVKLWPGALGALARVLEGIESIAGHAQS